MSAEPAAELGRFYGKEGSKCVGVGQKGLEAQWLQVQHEARVLGSWNFCSYRTSDICSSHVPISLALIPFNPLFLTHLQLAQSFLLTCFLTPTLLILRFYSDLLTFRCVIAVLFSQIGWEGQGLHIKLFHAAPHENVVCKRSV